MYSYVYEQMFHTAQVCMGRKPKLAAKPKSTLTKPTVDRTKAESPAPNKPGGLTKTPRSINQPGPPNSPNTPETLTKNGLANTKTAAHQVRQPKPPKPPEPSRT